MPKSPAAADLASLRVPTDVRLSPDGRSACYVVKSSSPDQTSYRTALWLVPTDGSEPGRQLTLGASHDAAPRWSPDGRWLAFLSDRGSVLRKGGAPRDKEDLQRVDATPVGLKDVVGRDIPRGNVQVWLLPLGGGEAHQLTDLPLDVGALEWSPDSSRLCIVSGATSAKLPESKKDAGEPPRRDIRLIDELAYQLNGAGFIHEFPPKLWIVDVADGDARRLTSGRSSDEQPAWSPDGKQIAYVSDRGADPDLVWRADVTIIDADGGKPVRVSGGTERLFQHPAWSPDGKHIAAVGHRLEAGNPTRDDIHVFRAKADQTGANLTAEADLYVDASMNSDLVSAGATGPLWAPDGKSILFDAPLDGSFELWRVRLADSRVEQLTRGRHMLVSPSIAPAGDDLAVVAYPRRCHQPAGPCQLRRARTREVDCQARQGQGHASAHRPHGRGMEGHHPRRATGALARGRRPQDPGLVLRGPGQGRQGWQAGVKGAKSGKRAKPAPLVVEIHGGPATLYGFSLMWEWQVLLAAGVSVYACNPRGSTGYGQAFAKANFRDWGDGPQADIEVGIDALVKDGLADPARVGVTGGSYGGYLTAWMVGHSDRYTAAVACRGVYDMTAEMLSGDLGGPLFGGWELDAQPWEDPALYQRLSPLSYATAIRTPLLIQHAEQDLRCPITQAEELFSVLRSLKRPVRLMRTPGETHELTRSGTPHRRIENLEHIRDWFVHYLVDGARTLPRT